MIHREKTSFRRTARKQMGEYVSKWEQNNSLEIIILLLLLLLLHNHHHHYHHHRRIVIYHYQRYHSGTVRMGLNNSGSIIVY
jgi:hypothetical protein